MSLDFVYDASGNRILVKDSLGGVETSLYNAANQLVRRVLVQDGETLRIDFAYDQYGRVVKQTRYSDAGGTTLVAVTTFSYNARGSLTEILTKDSEDATISEYDYTYDLAGQLTAVTEFQDGLDVSPNTINYGYDEQGQLTDDDVNEYDYDAGGNRDTGYTYVANPDEVHYTNSIANDGTWDYTYDLDGNLIEKSNESESWHYGYDHERHLIHVEHRDDMDAVDLAVDFAYDVFGNRVEKIVDADGDGEGAAVTMKFAIDGWNPAKSTPIGNENNDVWADLDARSSLITHYLRGDIVDQIIARTDGTTSRWNLTDHLGSVRDVIDESGVLKDSIRYDGFGNIVDETDDGERGRYAWTGREYDVETDLQYNRARYYDPTTGRWISQDPLGFDAGDSNLYRYVKNRATVASDPTGLFETDLHFYMTYYIAAKIGFRNLTWGFYDDSDQRVWLDDMAYAIAWGCETVDHHPETQPLALPIIQQRYHFRAPNGQNLDYKLRTHYQTASAPLVKFILEDRALAKQIGFADTSGPTRYFREFRPFRVGMGFHTFQDLYSHTGFRAGKGHGDTGYGGHEPDYPWFGENWKVASLMAKETFDWLTIYYKEITGKKPNTTDFRDIKKGLELQFKRQGVPDVMRDYEKLVLRGATSATVAGLLENKYGQNLWSGETDARCLNWIAFIRNELKLTKDVRYERHKEWDPLIKKSLIYFMAPIVDQ